VYLIKDKASVIGIDKGYAFNRYTRQYESIDIKKYLLIMFNEEPILCALVLFLGASALVVIGFAGYQSFLSGVNGMTTNELAKWGRLEGRLERGETFITKTYVGDQVDEGVKSAKEKTSENTDINTNNNNGSSILGIMSGHSAGFSKESNDFKIGFSETNQSSSKNYEITVEITKDDKYRGFVDRLFHYLVNENDKNIENFFKDLYEKVKNDLTEISEV